MATPKFDRIIQEFSRRIGNRLDTAFTPGGGAFPNGNLLDAVDAEAYVNKALNKLFDDVMESVKFDLKAFVSVFPELASPPASIPFTGGEYSIANPNAHFYKLFGAYYDSSTIIKIYTEDQYTSLKTGNWPDAEPTAKEPAMCALNTTISIFPSTLTSANIIYIMKPLSPTDGSFLTQNGSNDSPYHDTRNSRIAAIAEELYRKDKNSTK